MTTYARYIANGAVTHGILDGDILKEISNSPLEDHSETGKSHSVSDVTLLSPTEPSKVVAIGLNYKSHLGGRPGPNAHEPFLKAPPTVLAQNAAKHEGNEKMFRMQCMGTKKDGGRCGSMVNHNGWNLDDAGSIYCHNHRHQGRNRSVPECL